MLLKSTILSFITKKVRFCFLKYKLSLKQRLIDYGKFY